MSKGVYLGVEGYAHKVKSMYIGVDGVARKIKKAYLGVEGYARLFYSSEEIRKSDVSVSSVRNSHTYGASASADSHAVFAGGAASNYVDAYDSSLTKTSPTNLSNKVNGVCGCGFKGYSVFAGGSNTMGSYFNTVDSYSASMVKTSLTNLSIKRANAVMTHTTNYVFVVGGANSDGPVDTSEVYNAQLVKVSNASFGMAENIGGVYCMGYGILYGGMYNYGGSVSISKYIDYVDDELTLKGNTHLELGAHSCAGATASRYALFAGGDAAFDGSVVSTVWACDSSDLSVRSISPLPVAVRNLAGVSLEGYAIFAGGWDGDMSSGKSVSVVVLYDSNLTKNVSYLTTGRGYLLGASVGNFGLFAGGVNGEGTSTTSMKSVEVFEYGG